MVALTVRGWVLLRGSMPPFCTNLEGGAPESQHCSIAGAHADSCTDLVRWRAAFFSGGVQCGSQAFNGAVAG